MQLYQHFDDFDSIPPVRVERAGGFCFFKDTIFATWPSIALLWILCLMGPVTADGQSSTSRKAKTPNTKTNGFLKPYGHPNQSRFSFFAGAGLGAYSGDICLLSDGRLQHYYFNPGVTAGLNYRITNFISVRWDNGYQLLRAKSRADTWGDWSFRSHMASSTVGFQLNLTSKSSIERNEKRWDGYLFGGAGILFYQTKSSVDAEKFAAFSDILAKPKHPFAAVFPVGIGVSRYWKNQWSVGLECTYRFTTTDLLDGASLTTDTSPRTDDYLTVQVVFTKQLFQLFSYGDYMKRK